MTDRDSLLERLREAGRSEASRLDLAGTALVLAALDRPEARIEDYRRHLATLAADTARLAGAEPSAADRAASLGEAIYRLHGYAGDTATYDDVQNANLMSVIDRRRGLPVALGILCIDAARAQGWEMAGLNFPGHFLVELSAGGASIVVDPFHAAEVLDEEGLRRRLRDVYGKDIALDASHRRPVSDRDILLRLQNNIKMRALRSDDTDWALAVVERMVLIAPRRIELRLELATLGARSGKLMSAVRELEAFLAGAGAADRSEEADALLKKLKNRLN